MLREGRRQVAGFYFAGDVFGLESVKQHSVTAQAITNAKVRIFKKRALAALATSNLEVADRLLALTTRELARKQDHLLVLHNRRGTHHLFLYRHGPTRISKRG